jgi:hypothetical protein
MHVGFVQDFIGRIRTRPAQLRVAGCLLLAVFLIWTVRQSWRTQEAIDRAAAAEKAADQARTDAEQAHAQLQGQGRPRKDPAIRRSHHDDPEEIARVKQLREEIDDLMRIEERVEDVLATPRPSVAKKTAAAPSRTP